MRPLNTTSNMDVAEYILHCHDGDARAAIEAMQEEIQHLQRELRIAAAAVCRGYTRGWAPNEERDAG